ncbi:MAG: ssDNA-binding domain-containing protein [Acidobacteriia bacterium]|nr:ssDNA-binding domain-containing protein [Terriglobia bacterium]
MQEFADQIVASLEAGIKPWVKPWDESKCGGPQAPINPTTGARYHGINVLILGISLLAFQTGDPRWCSFLQAKEKGWNVRKGAKATTIFFTKKLTVKDTKEDAGEDDEKTVRMLRHYPVFHASQIEGIPEFKPPGIDETPWRRPEAADLILQNTGAVIRIGGDRAFYSPSTDHIQLPPDSAFRGPPEFAATALHELGHWTGHQSRLNREEGMKARYGSAAYAMEELRAELSSAFIAGELGIPADIPQHASYIASWLPKLKEDKRAIFHAAADAQRIVDMVLGFHPDFAASVEPQPVRPSEPTAQQSQERPAA